MIALTHMLNQSDMRMVNKVKGVDMFLGGHEHCYMIYKNNKSIAIKSGSNFESFNEIIVEISDSKLIKETTETKPENKS